MKWTLCLKQNQTCQLGFGDRGGNIFVSLYYVLKPNTLISHLCYIADTCGNKDDLSKNARPTQPVIEVTKSKYSPSTPTPPVNNFKIVCKVGFVFCSAVQACNPTYWVCHGIVDCGFENKKILGKQELRPFWTKNLNLMFKIAQCMYVC